VRANQARALAGKGGSIFEAVGRATPLSRYELRLRARPGVAARTAVLELRATRVTLRPTWRPGGRLEPLEVNVVEAKEVNAPAGVESIRWVLLRATAGAVPLPGTSLPVATFADARRVVALYAKRWLIEEYHKALKTGAGAERTELLTARPDGSRSGAAGNDFSSCFKASSSRKGRPKNVGKDKGFPSLGLGFVRGRPSGFLLVSL